MMYDTYVGNLIPAKSCKRNFQSNLNDRLLMEWLTNNVGIQMVTIMPVDSAYSVKEESCVRIKNKTFLLFLLF